MSQTAMSQTATSQTALDAFSVTRQAMDPRADGGRRVIHVSAKQVVIERTVQNVRMKVAVPVAAYRRLVLSVRPQSATATIFLRHEDEDLDVALASGEAMAVARTAKAWGAVFGMQIAIEEAAIAIGQPFARQRKRDKRSRRSSFSRRRKVGISSRLDHSFGHEHEIIARN